MTDLEKAIAEVAAHAPWHFQMLETSGDPSCDRAVVAILSAVVSGELIPTTERDAAMAVKVKPLVWKPVYSSGNYSRSIASGEYRINEVGLCGWELLMDENNKIVYETCDMAKAAAQADHEARIRAAIGGVE